MPLLLDVQVGEEVKNILLAQMHRHPAQHLRGRVTFDGYVPEYWGGPRTKRVWKVQVHNTRTGRIVNSDSPFMSLSEAVDNALYRTSIAREAWMLSFRSKDLK